MRKGWTETTLGDIAKCAGGTAFPHEFQGGDTGTPFVKVSDMNESGNERYLISSNNYVSKEAIKSLGARVWPKGTIVFAKVGAALLTEKRRMLVKDTIFDNNIMGLIPKAIIESHFLYLFMETVKLGDYAQPGAVPSINNSIVSGIAIKLPPLSEQRRIVDVVSSVDAYIDALQKQADMAWTARNAVLHELLSAGGDDWTETTLGKIASLKNGDRGKNYPSANQRTSYGVPFINAGHLANGKVVLDSMDYISEETFNSLSAGKIEENDILYCLRGTVGKFGIVDGINRGAIASSLVILRVGKASMTSFVYLFLDSAYAKIQLGDLRNGAVQPNLSASSLASFKVVLPPLAEQKRIVEIVSSMDDVIQSTEQAVVDAKNLRSGLLSDLLSGEHQIPESYDRLLGAA